MAEADSGSVGAGQLDPASWADETNRAVFIVRQILGRICTMKLAKVIAVHPGEGEPPGWGTVDVQPLVSQVDGAGNAVPHGIVYGLPYFRLQSGTWAVVADPAINDIGLVVCADRDISAVKGAIQGGKSPLVAPATFAQFSLSDGVYLGGVMGAAVSQYLWLRPDGTFKLSDHDGNVVESGSGGLVLTPKVGQPVTVNGALVVTGNLQIGGNIVAQDGSTYAGSLQTTGDVVAGVGSADQVGLQSHTHGGVQTGGGTSGSPTPGS